MMFFIAATGGKDFVKPLIQGVTPNETAKGGESISGPTRLNEGSKINHLLD